MNEDLKFMLLALEEARLAAQCGEVPVGAVVVAPDSTVLARAHNKVESGVSALHHAEILALGQAAQALGSWRLDTLTMYVTKEPCAMCAGAAVNARIGRIVFGMGDPRAGACGGALDVTGHSGMLWHPVVTGGVLAEESAQLIRDFFRQRRLENKTK